MWILGVGEQQAPRFLGSPSDPAPELMQLGQPESVGALDHHDRGIGNVDADFHHRGGDQDGNVAPFEGGHHGLLLGRFESAVE